MAGKREPQASFFGTDNIEAALAVNMEFDEAELMAELELLDQGEAPSDSKLSTAAPKPSDTGMNTSAWHCHGLDDT